MAITAAVRAHRMVGRSGVRRRNGLELIGFLWEERAAIAELDGRLSREEAEHLAWLEVGIALLSEEHGKGKTPAGSGVTSQWLPLPMSYYGDATPP